MWWTCDRHDTRRRWRTSSGHGSPGYSLRDDHTSLPYETPLDLRLDRKPWVSLSLTRDSPVFRPSASHRPITVVEAAPAQGFWSDVGVNRAGDVPSRTGNPALPVDVNKWRPSSSVTTLNGGPGPVVRDPRSTTRYPSAPVRLRVHPHQGVRTRHELPRHLPTSTSRPDTQGC